MSVSVSFWGHRVMHYILQEEQSAVYLALNISKWLMAYYEKLEQNLFAKFIRKSMERIAHLLMVSTVVE